MVTTVVVLCIMCLFHTQASPSVSIRQCCLYIYYSFLRGTLATTYVHTFYTKVLFHVMYVLCNSCIQLQVYIEFTTLHTVYIMYSLTTCVLFAYSSVGSTNLPLLLSTSERKWPWSFVSLHKLNPSYHSLPIDNHLVLRTDQQL